MTTPMPLIEALEQCARCRAAIDLHARLELLGPSRAAYNRARWSALAAEARTEAMLRTLKPTPDYELGFLHGMRFVLEAQPKAEFTCAKVPSSV